MVPISSNKPKSIKPKVIDVSPEEFVQLSEPPRLIDVRSRLEYILFRASDAINLSLPRVLMVRVPILRNWLLPEWFLALPKDEPIAVICLTAHRSPIVAQQLIKAGFTRVFNITGGMMAWQRGGLPMHKGHFDRSL
ncbi:MAG: rhodanese-like domain-containing protein [Cyanobacteria bacterium P01_D01_bin.44]